MACEFVDPLGDGVKKPELQGMLEHMTKLDHKLDRLSGQMEACLLGIQGIVGSNSMDHSLGLEHLPCCKSSRGDHLLQQIPEGNTMTQFESVRTSHHSNRNTRSSCNTSEMSSLKSNSPSWRAAPRLSRYTESVATGRVAPPAWPSTGSMQLRVRRFMSNPESSFPAGMYNRLNSTLILLMVLCGTIQGTSLQIFNPDVYMGIECFIEALFLLEISTLFAVCLDRQHFFLKFYNVVDVLSAMPLALRVYKIMTGGHEDVYTIVLGGFVPVVRLLKAMRHFQISRLLANAFILAKEAVPILVFYYAVVWLLFTAIMYAVEERSNLPSLPDAMWLTIMTMTTVGYGDVIPRTGPGRLAASALVLVSTLYMAIPLGIIGSCFSAVWSDRDCILLLERLRCCFAEIGCSHWDVPRLFSRFDKTKTGSLDALEFMNMATHLRLGLSEDRILRLFKLWANDEQGNRIEAAEFQQALFPTACLTTLAKQRREENTSRFSRGSTVVFESANEDRATLER